MPHWVYPPQRSLLALVLFASLVASSAQAQVRFVPAAVADPIVDVLQKGQSLEAERRWGEALTYYEEAVRSHPNQKPLEERLDMAKIHYDLGRRYSDQSFQKALAAISYRDALELYADVLLKINVHYVSDPQWHQILARGTSCLEVALYEKSFAARHLSRVTAPQIEAFRRDLHNQLGARPVRSRQEARDAVTVAANLAQQRLGISPTAVVMEYVSGASGGLDNYSTYLTGDQLKDIYSQIDGNFVGLGIELKAIDQALLLVHVIPGSPAERAGMKAGDRIVAVDGNSTTKVTTDQAAAMLQGVEGSSVEVTVETPGLAPRRLMVRREHVEVPSVEQVKIVDKQNGIGYFKLTSFQKTTTQDVDAALWKLHREGMRSLVMDLRGNPGGLLTTSVEVADRFIEAGTIVSTRGRSPQEDYTYTAHKPGTWRVPLVVLIDGDSASASEIFAGAIRDNRRGTIVGVRSYGKGSVQGIFPLSVGDAGLRLTTAKFYSPSGRPIAKVGVEPDLVVRQVAKPATDAVAEPESASDAILEAGLQAARQQLASR